MLTKIEIGDNWTRFKSDDPIPAGLYYCTRQRLNVNPQLKKAVAAVAATGPKGFMWLLPYEPWVKRVLEGFEPVEKAAYEKVNDKAAVALHIEHCWDRLRDWQKLAAGQAVHALTTLGYYRRGWIAPLGAGKTLAGLCLLHNFERPLVLAPTHLHGEWETEAKKWGLNLPRISTYQSAHKFADADAIVADEVLATKNPLTKAHKYLKELGYKADLVVGFTGTPSSVNPMDLRWLRAVAPGCVPEQETAWRFLWGIDTELVEVAPERSAYVTKTWDNEAVARFTAPYCGIIDLDEIQDELPAIEYRKIYVDCHPRFKMVLKGAGTEHGKAKAVAQARQMSDGFIYDDAGQASNTDDKKVEAIRELVEGLDEPAVLFAAWDHSVQRLHSLFVDRKPAVLSGTTGDYGAEIRRFRDGQTSLLIANARIATGMNLQERCRIMVFMSNSTSPVDRKQAIGRIYRPGQKAKGVVIYDVLMRGTLDEKALEVLTAHSDESETYVQKALELEARRLAGEETA